MKLYTFSVHDYESSSNFQFTHAEDFTEEEFLSDVKHILQKYGEHYLKSEQEQKRWCGEERWAYYCMQHMSELGYSEPEEVCISTGPFTGIMNRDNDEWKEMVGEELFEKGLSINREIEALFGEDTGEF